MNAVTENAMQSDNFREDWYGFATNQISHLALGVLFAWLIALFYHSIVGEYPRKLEMIAVLAAGYMAFELFSQGWNGFDTIEDWTFFSVWGAGGATAAFSEVEIGSIILSLNPAAPIPFAIAATIHLALGSLQRLLAARLSE